MRTFHERLRETFSGAPGMEGVQSLLSGLETALRQQFPLCHVDTEAISERILSIAEELAALRRRTSDASPELPSLNPDLVPVVLHSEETSEQETTAADSSD